ncbi:MAG: thiamine ABC transporter substrate binding subunit, partial [Cucumibacter sp.]
SVSPLRPFLLAALLLATPAAAQDQPNLTIYTYDAFAADWGPGPLLKSGFEASCGCTVTFVAVNSSIAALRRVQLEGEATKADIVLGLDTSFAAGARATGLFAVHGLDLSGLALPVDWADPDFVPFDYGWFAFVYNRETLPSPPASFEALAGVDGLKIIIEDPRADTPGLGLVLWVKAAYGEHAAEIWTALAPHIVTVTQSWSAAYSLFLAGEADMVLSYTTSPSYHLIAEGDRRFAAARFREGHYLQVEIAAVLASSPHPDLARKFLAYLVSPEGQATIPTTNWMFPVNPKVTLPQGFATPLTPEATLLIDPTTVEANQRAWIGEMLDAIQ